MLRGSDEESSQVPTYEHWINGAWTPPTSHEYLESLNPIDDGVFARVARGCDRDVSKAVDSAHASFQDYQKTAPKQRESWLLQAANLLEQQQPQFIEVLIDEIGSPVTKAKREIVSAAGLLRAAAGATKQLSGKTLPTDVPGRISISLRQPLGVVAGVTPFNVPLIKAIKHSAMPLATGNTTVLLPSEEAPTISLKIAELFSEAGLPDGALNVVTGVGSEIGDALVTNPLVKMVGFTGSTRVGKHIGGLCGKQAKRVTLEMGGKNALVVLEDANIEKAIQSCVLGAFFYQGQICMATSRIYVQRSVYQEFLSGFVDAARRLPMGDLRDESTVIGPIINQRQRERIRNHVADAIDSGSNIRYGGEWEQNCLQPTVITEVPPSAILHREETFGPVAAVYDFDRADDALEMVNDTAYGLSGAVYTKNLDVAMQFAKSMKAGMVHINGSTIQEEAHVPFGGVGDSGLGRESTDTDLAEMTEWKWITIQTD